MAPPRSQRIPTCATLLKFPLPDTSACNCTTKLRKGFLLIPPFVEISTLLYWRWSRNPANQPKVGSEYPTCSKYLRQNTKKHQKTVVIARFLPSTASPRRLFLEARIASFGMIVLESEFPTRCSHRFQQDCKFRVVEMICFGNMGLEQLHVMVGNTSSNDRCSIPMFNRKHVVLQFRIRSRYWDLCVDIGLYHL